MKKALAIVLAFLMILCLFAACGEKKAAESGGQTTRAHSPVRHSREPNRSPPKRIKTASESSV